MINGLWGKKVGMTQVFSDTNKVIPVTLIDIADWYITQIKTVAKDGYEAVQLGCVKPRFAAEGFSLDWLKHTKKYFSALKEVRLSESIPSLEVGQRPDIASILEQGKSVDVFGTSIGRGFAGAMKRHGFAGGPATHGDMLGRRVGSIGNMRTRGRVIKGKRMPGHFGVEKHVANNLEIIKIEPQAHMLLVKGCVPGKTGSLLFLKRRG
jgi:large subunit ribosomal protein L3